MFRFYKAFFVSMLAIGLFSSPVHADFSRSATIGLAITGAFGVVLHAVSAAASFKSKYEISPIEGEPRRATQESATATHGLAAFFTLTAAASLACTPLAIVPLAGFGMMFAGMGIGSTALSFHKDSDRSDHDWHITSLATGVGGAVASIGLFLGSYVSNLPN